MSKQAALDMSIAPFISDEVMDGLAKASLSI